MDPSMGSMRQMDEMRMVMPTDDHEVFRMIRPAVAALQVRLAEAGLHGGAINGLFGPSTARALLSYQERQGLERTGLPGLETVLALLEMEKPEASSLETLHRPPSMAGHQMEGTETPEREVAGAMRPMAMGQEKGPDTDGGVGGDPHHAKSLELMEMPAMVVENRHTASVRAVRELVGAMQLKLAAEGVYDGPVDGLPYGPELALGLSRYQEVRGLEETGSFDFATVLDFFGSNLDRAVDDYGPRIGLEDTPVAMDEGLMSRSRERAAAVRGGRGGR